MAKAELYHSDVYWSEDDQGYVAIAPDLPGCSAFGETRSKAIEELEHAKKAWLESAGAAGNIIPDPSPLPSPESYSGRLLVRMPRTLHKILVERARTEGVSLNQLVVFYLTSSVTSQHPVKASSARGSMYVLADPHQVPAVTEVGWTTAETALTRASAIALAGWLQGSQSEHSYTDDLGTVLWGVTKVSAPVVPAGAPSFRKLWETPNG